MTLTTSRGKTFPVDWAFAPVGPAGDMMLRLRDDRPLSEIAADFEGCDRFHRQSEEEGDLDFDGYTVLSGLARPADPTDPTAVQLTLRKPVKE